MIQGQQIPDEVEQLIQLGINGHFPFLYVEDIREASQFGLAPKTTRKHMKDFIRTTLFNFHRHQTFERKKDAIHCMDKIERAKFISYFLKLVEHHGLQQGQDFH